MEPPRWGAADHGTPLFLFGAKCPGRAFRRGPRVVVDGGTRAKGVTFAREAGQSAGWRMEAPRLGLGEPVGARVGLEDARVRAQYG